MALEAVGSRPIIRPIENAYLFDRLFLWYAPYLELTPLGRGLGMPCGTRIHYFFAQEYGLNTREDGSEKFTRLVVGLRGI